MKNTSDRRSYQRMLFRVLLGMLGLAFLGVCALFAVLLANTWREYATFEEQEAEYRERLAAIQREKAGREAYLRKLLDDPEFRERVVRERLGYSREDEVIFRFQKE